MYDETQSFLTNQLCPREHQTEMATISAASLLCNSLHSAHSLSASRSHEISICFRRPIKQPASKRTALRTCSVSERWTTSFRCSSLVSKRRSSIWTKISALVKGTDYDFREDGAELEVRIPLPSVEDAGRQLTARYVAVEAQARSLTVGVETIHGVRILLNASNLYGSIKPAETVWFVDETEIVLSLKKADDELVWHDLVQTWESLVKGVSSLLKGASVYIVGESTEINWAVAQELCTGLKYVPLQTKQLIEHIAKASAHQILMEEGVDAVAKAEDAVLASLSQHVRCVVATLGGSEGAAIRYDGWNGIHAGFSVWLSLSQAQDEESAVEEAVRAKQTRSQAYAKSDVVVALSGWDSTAVRPTAHGALQALKYLLEAEKDLPGKKSLYVRLGCRGDWPDIMPPGWDPASPQDEEKRAESLTL